MKQINNAIILISDITKGMKSIGSKSLLNIYKNTTILEYQIQYLKKNYYPINIYLCTGFDHEKIFNLTNKYKNIHFSYNENYEYDNQVSSLIKCLLEYNLNHALILSNGLIPIKKIKIDKTQSSIELTDKNTKVPFEIGANSKNDLNYLFYDLPYRWTEHLFLNHDAIVSIANILSKESYKKMFLFELINILIDRGVSINTNYITKNLPIKINSIKDLIIAKKYYEKNLHKSIK